MRTAYKFEALDASLSLAGGGPEMAMDLDPLQIEVPQYKAAKFTLIPRL